MGTLGEEKENRSPPARGPQGGEEGPKESSWTRDTETTSPGHQGFSLRGEVFTCWCVNAVTLKSLSGSSLTPDPGNLRNGWPHLITDLYPRPLLLVVSVLGRGYRKIHICISLRFGAQLMGRE